MSRPCGVITSGRPVPQPLSCFRQSRSRAAAARPVFAASWARGSADSAAVDGQPPSQSARNLNLRVIGNEVAAPGRPDQVRVRAGELCHESVDGPTRSHGTNSDAGMLTRRVPAAQWLSAHRRACHPETGRGTAWPGGLGPVAAAAATAVELRGAGFP